MDLKFVFIFVLLAFTGAQGDDDDNEECSEESAGACLAGLLVLAEQDDPDMGEACETMRQAYKCLKDKVEICLSEEKQEEVQSDLNGMRDVIIVHCGTVDEEEEESPEEAPEEEEEEDPHAKCFEAEQEYIMGCVEEATEKAIRTFLVSGERDLDKIKCGSYSIIADCFVTKAEEKCGDEAAQALHAELSDLPEEIKESCEAAGIQDIFDLDLL